MIQINTPYGALLSNIILSLAAYGHNNEMLMHCYGTRVVFWLDVGHYECFTVARGHHFGSICFVLFILYWLFIACVIQCDKAEIKSEHLISISNQISDCLMRRWTILCGLWCEKPIRDSAPRSENNGRETPGVGGCFFEWGQKSHDF